jgi:hypothetical protein
MREMYRSRDTSSESHSGDSITQRATITFEEQEHVKEKNRSATSGLSRGTLPAWIVSFSNTPDFFDVSSADFQILSLERFSSFKTRCLDTPLVRLISCGTNPIKLLRSIHASAALAESTILRLTTTKSHKGGFQFFPCQ